MAMGGYVVMDNAKRTTTQEKGNSKKDTRKTTKHTAKKKRNMMQSKGKPTEMNPIHGDLSNEE